MITFKELYSNLDEFKVLSKGQRKKIGIRMKRQAQSSAFKTKVAKSKLKVASPEKIKVKAAKLAKQKYDWAIENGIAKELARKVLPEGNTVSRMYMNGTLRSWVHYIELRSANGTQKEHMNVAQACAVEIAKIFPLIGDILND